MAEDRRRLLVTDHAIVRYCERILGIDIKRAVVDELLGDGREEMVRGMVNGELRVGHTDIVLRVVNSQVITVIRNDSRDGHRPSKKPSVRGKLRRARVAFEGEE